MTDIDPFKISALVPDFQAQMDEYRTASAATRAHLRSNLDVSYGPAPRQRLDLFFPPSGATGRPIHIFIHGGYWRAQMKDDYSFVADGITAAGAIAAVVEYTLMPGNRMADLVRETRDAIAWLAAHAHEFSGDGTKLSASGHSAGAHLCSYLASRSPHETALPATPVKSLLLLSGIYDLHPIPASYLQPELYLTAEEVAHWSPIDAVPSPATHFEIVVGHAETPPFHQQAQDYAYELGLRGADVERITASGHEHMSLVRELGHADRPLGRLVAEAIERSRL